MKRIIKETLNEKVFAELSAKTAEEKTTYQVAVYFKWTEKSVKVAYNNLKDAKKAYKFVTKI